MSSRSSITTLLFDWDGTIVDTAHLGLIAFQKSFAQLGFAFPDEIYKSAYSPNWYSLYEAMSLPREKWDEADRLWMQYYGEQTAEFLHGAGETIDYLQRKGYRLGVVSSASNSRLTREIERLGLEAVFQVVICNEQMQNKKPHPEGLQTAMRLLNCEESCACYIGDSPEDIAMGKSAGVMTVGVRSTYPTNWKLAESRPDLYLENLAAITDHF
jgi:HAD superfamily hydrolase (TIGR01549 family)